MCSRVFVLSAHDLRLQRRRPLHAMRGLLSRICSIKTACALTRGIVGGFGVTVWEGTWGVRGNVIQSYYVFLA